MRIKSYLIVFIVFALLSIFNFSLVSPAQAGKKNPVYHPFFGDLHAHTRFSDGWEGSPADAYASAKDAGADFMATTDHAAMLTAEEWDATLQAALAYTTENFVAMPAYEYWMPGFGEVATYNVPIFPSEHPNLQPQRKMPRWDVPASFYDWLSAQTGGVGLFVHPTDYGDNFDDFAYWSASRDESMGLLEVHNLGSWEMPQQLLDYEASYIMALDKGWHVMPAANSDTHSPDWISGYEVRTVLLAPSLSPANLYDAMRSSRGYATLDKNLRIDYRLNGAVMGSILAPMESYTAQIHIEDPDGVPSDNITLLEIVSDGGLVVASRSCNSTSVDWEVILNSATARYYYVRVTTASNVSGSEGLTAWTAPVWTGR